MARINIDIGVLGNPATGDTLRTAMTKINNNFEDLYLLVGDPSTGLLTTNITNGDVKIQPNGTGSIEIDTLSIQNSTITSITTNSDITLTPNGTGNVVLGNFTFNADQTVGAGQDNYVFTYDHSTGTIGLEATAAGDVTASSTTTFTNKTFDANGTGNSISNIDIADFTSGVFLDEDNMASNSATAIASQQSIKAYVDSQILTKDNTDEITEGSTNLYFTNARADARITNALKDEDNMASDSATHVPSQQSVKAYVDAEDANIASDSMTFTNKAGNISQWTNDSNYATQAYVDARDIGDLAVTGSTISAPSNADLTLTTSGTGCVSVDGIQIKGTELSSTDSTQITIKENLHVTGNITGTLTASGNDTEVQFNNSGAFAGDSGLTFDSSGGKTLKVGAGGGTVKANSFQGADSVSTGVTFQSDNGSGVKANHLQIQSHTGSVQTVFPSGAVDFTSAGSVDFTGTTVTGLALTMVGDDSSGTAVNTGETFKFAGATGVTTAVSGDTLTITGTAQDFAFSSITGKPTTIAGYGITDAASSTATALTVVGDDSSGTAVTLGETFKVAGATGITTAVSGDTLTITGPTLTSFITASSSDTLTNKTFDVEGTGNSISNIDVADFKAAAIVTEAEGIGSNDNDTTLPTSAAVKDYVDTEVSGVSGASTGDITFTGSTIQSPSNADITLDPSGTGGVVAQAAMTFNGNAIFNTGVEEAFDTLTSSTGTVTHDCDNGHIFYHTSPSADFTANFTNLGLTAEYGTTLTVIVNQGATARLPTAVQIGGAAQTLNWQGGVAPTGTDNGIDVVSFTVLNDGGTYVVLAQMVDFT